MIELLLRNLYEEKSDEHKLLASKCFFSIYGFVSRGKDASEGRHNSGKIALVRLQEVSTCTSPKLSSLFL
jgi:hypothetical protein